jgi:hypothetical protein
MVQVDLNAERVGGKGLGPLLASLLGRQHPDAVVRLKIHGRAPEGGRTMLRAAALRALAPPTMNVSVRLAEDPAFRIDT